MLLDLEQQTCRHFKLHIDYVGDYMEYHAYHLEDDGLPGA